MCYDVTILSPHLVVYKQWRIQEFPAGYVCIALVELVENVVEAEDGTDCTDCRRVPIWSIGVLGTEGAGLK